MSLNDLIKMMNEDEQEKSIEEEFKEELIQSAEKHNAELEREYQENHKDKKPKFKPSNIHKEPRYFYFYFKGYEQDYETKDFRSLLRLNYGTSAHEFLQSFVLPYMPNLKLSDGKDFIIPDETEIRQIPKKYQTDGNKIEVLFHNDYWNIGGMVDFLGSYKNLKIVGEIKTEDYAKWKNRYEVKEDHKQQAVAYSMCLGVNDIFFPYVGLGVPYKINPPIKVIHYVVEEDGKEEIKDKIKLVNKYLREDKIPPKCDNCTRWCEYKNVCKKL